MTSLAVLAVLLQRHRHTWRQILLHCFLKTMDLQRKWRQIRFELSFWRHFADIALFTCWNFIDLFKKATDSASTFPKLPMAPLINIFYKKIVASLFSRSHITSIHFSVKTRLNRWPKIEIHKNYPWPYCNHTINNQWPGHLIFKIVQIKTNKYTIWFCCKSPGPLQGDSKLAPPPWSNLCKT